MTALTYIITIASSSVVTFTLSIAAFKYDLITIKSKSSQEVSKADQDKITTASATIDLVEKLRTTMDKQFNEMQKKIESLEKTVEYYKLTCDNCEVRIKTKRKP